MQFGIAAIVNDRTLSILSVAPQADARGMDALWVGEHTHMPVETRHRYARSPELPDIYKRFPDPWTTLAAAAACTRRIRLGTCICLVAEHPPLALAKTIATVDGLSEGRVDVGMGYGWNAPEMRNNGVDPRRRREVFREHVQAMQRLWTKETASFAGEFVRFGESWSWPKPVQRPHPPLLVGAAPLRHTFDDIAAIADGWIPDLGWAGDRLGEHVAALRAAMKAAGRDPAGMPIVLTNVNGFRRDTLDEFRARLPAPRLIEGWAALGVTQIILGVPVHAYDFLCECLDLLAGLKRTWAGAGK
ncbi:MAG: TIGR03619 family F420-dependent LLM class oxidoreductase [Gammaproteobacteria bacterium]